MIESFASQEARKILEQIGTRKLPQDIQDSTHLKLIALHAATSLRDIYLVPGNRLEKLTGDRAGQYSIRINDQWRICFVWTAENNAASVDIVDYR